MDEQQTKELLGEMTRINAELLRAAMALRRLRERLEEEQQPSYEDRLADAADLAYDEWRDRQMEEV